jgi:hypothetical protein
MFGSLCRQGLLLILLPLGAAYAIGPGDSRSTDSFAASRNQIIGWASGFVAKTRGSVSSSPKVPLEETYQAGERLIFGKTARREQCALHLGRRRESGEWIFSLYLENKSGDLGPPIEDSGLEDAAMSFEGRVVVQSQPRVSNGKAVTSLDLHTTASSISLLSLSASPGLLEEDSLSIILDDDSNIVQATYRFVKSTRPRDEGKRDPMTCHFDHLF